MLNDYNTKELKNSYVLNDLFSNSFSYLEGDISINPLSFGNFDYYHPSFEGHDAEDDDDEEDIIEGYLEFCESKLKEDKQSSKEFS